MHSSLRIKDFIRSYFSGGVICTLLLLLVSGAVSAQSTIYEETFGDNGTSNTTYSTYNKWSALSSMFTDNKIKENYSGDGKVGKNNVDTSSGYDGASGKSAAWHSASAGTSSTTMLKITNIKIENCKNIHLSFGLFLTNGKVNTNKINVSYIVDGNEEKELSYNIQQTSKWTLCETDINTNGKSLTIIFNHQTSGGFTARIDDIKLTANTENPTKCANPIFNPKDGTTFEENLTINASTTTTGAKIVYTTAEGETLTKDSEPFPTEGLTITETTTIRAMAVMEDGSLENSDIATATYTKTKKAVTLNFEQNEYTVDINATTTVKATTDKPNASIKYTTDADENVCIIDESTGEVLAGNTPATVTITATIDEDGEYQGATATCTLNIIDPNFKGFKYKKVTKQEDITDNGIYIIVCEKMSKAMSNNNGTTNMNSVDISIKDNTCTLENINKEGEVYEITLIKESEKNYYLSTSLGFLTGNGDKTTLTPKTDKENNGIWTIDLSSTNLITNKATTTRFINLYDNNNAGTHTYYFGAYKNTTQSRYDVTLYKRIENISNPNVTITDAQYATYVTPCAVEFGNEVTAYVVDKINDADVSIKQITSAPANTAVIVYAEQAGTYSLTQTDNAEEVGTNELKYSETEFTNTTHNIYVLSKKNGNVGFRRLALNQTVPARKVYIIKENTTTEAKEFMPIGGETTGITNIVNENRDTKKIYYNLNGMRVDNPQKGIYIVNGKKVIF